CLLAELIPNSELTIIGFVLGIAISPIVGVVIVLRIIAFKGYVLYQLDLSKQNLPCFKNFDAFWFDLSAHMIEDPDERERIFQIGVSNLKNSIRMKAYYCMYLLRNQENESRHKIRALIEEMKMLSTNEMDVIIF